LYFCNGENISTTIQDTVTDQSQCVLPTAVQSQGCRGPPSHDEFKIRVKNRSTLTQPFSPKDADPKKKKRTISPSHDGRIIGSNQEPSIAALMTAVMNDEMTFQYVNLVRINDLAAGADNFGGPTNNQQGIIELAWLMGTNNDYTDVNANYQEFGGTDLTVQPPNGPPDMFFVMHFHVDHVLYDDSGTPYVGIYAYNAFHGQYVNGRNRVDGNSNNRNQRTPIVECPGYGGPQGNNRYVYPGWADPNTDTESITYTFLNYLAQQQLLHRHVLAPIIVTAQSEQDNCEFFDWSLLPAGTTGSVAANGAPYTRPAGF